MQEIKKTINIREIISESFIIYKETLSFQFIYGLLYFLLFYIGVKISIDYLNINNEIQNLSLLMLKNPNEFKNQLYLIAQKKEFAWLTFCIVIIKTLLYPLQIGLINVMNKKYLKEKTGFDDMLVGYKGSLFFVFVSFAMFFGYTELFLRNLLIFPSYFWIIIMIFVGPVMFFNQMPMFGAMQYSFKLCLKYFWVVTSCVLLGFVLSWLGFALFFVGILLSFSFQLCVIMVLYRRLALQKDKIE